MRRTSIWAAAAVAVGLLALPQSALAHCDTLDGPVAQAAQQALESGDVGLALPFAPAVAEAEIRESFAAARRVRALGPDARAVADRSFLETVVRLHRAGEGVGFSGLKPAGLDHGPVIPAAEAAVAGGDLAPLRAALVSEIDHALAERLAHVRELQSASAPARTPQDLERTRARVSAELEFVTFAEGIRQAAIGASEHHED